MFCPLAALVRRPLPGLIAALATLAAPLAATPVGAAAFTQGDLYLVTNSMGISAPGIMRIEMPSGTTSVFYPFPGGNAMSSTAVYDPYRDKIIFSHGAVAGPLSIDAAGAVTPLGSGLPTFAVLASRGDGLIYTWNHWGDGSDGFYYIDAAGVLHELLNEAGTGIYSLGSGRYLSELIYEPTTNSLIGLTHSYGTPSPCSDGSQVCVAKIPLTSNGHQAAGPVVTTQFEVSATGEVVVGAGYGPGGKILVTIDTNSNALESRMSLLDPVGMTVTPFASNDNTFAAATNAGTYSHVLGQAVIDDTGENVLRAFSMSGTSAGAVVATGVSGGGSNEWARLLEVGRDGVTLDVPPRAQRSELALSVSPNPATVSTTFGFLLAHAQPVSLVIRDLAGRTVRALARSEWRPAGDQAIAWDGRDASGARVRPGVYSAVLRTPESAGVRAVIVLR